MRRKKKNKLDHTGIGFLIGFSVPVLVFLIFYLVGNHQVSLADFARGLWKLNALIKLGSLCVFVNSIVFMIFIRMKFEKTARGILGATIMYAFVVLISKAI
ncbi:MAG: hypothetical protein JXR61_03945 [Prolixibacteraceae bacterium]|nr:hypothetical protein [Prolixibacteraceae bacterium]